MRAFFCLSVIALLLSAILTSAPVSCRTHSELLSTIQTEMKTRESEDEEDEAVELETDIDDSSKATLKNMLGYLLDLIGVNEDIIEQLDTDQQTMDSLLTSSIDMWSSQVNEASGLFDTDSEMYKDFETQLEELNDQTLAYEEELDEIEIEMERVNGDLEEANNNYLNYLVLADEAKEELNSLVGVLETILDMDETSSSTTLMEIKESENQGESVKASNELLNKMTSSLSKIKSFSMFSESEAQKIDKVSGSFLATSSKTDLEETYTVISEMLSEMEVTGTVWESYQIQMMEATNNYDDDLQEWDNYIDTALTTIADTEDTISTMVAELETYMESSEEILAQSKNILSLLEEFKTKQDEFYSSEFARLQEENVMIQKIYDVFAAEVYSGEELSELEVEA